MSSTKQANLLDPVELAIMSLGIIPEEDNIRVKTDDLQRNSDKARLKLNEAMADLEATIKRSEQRKRSPRGGSPRSRGK